MKMLLKVAAFLTMAFGLAAFQAEATLIYDNGPINGTITAFTINNGYSVSDSFTVSSTVSLTSAQIGLWAFSGDKLSSVGWSIGTSAFANNVSSGTGSPVTNTFQYTNGSGYDIYESTFGISGSLVAGTYWFTLQNAVTLGSHSIFWDQNNGPSSAQQKDGGSPYSIGGSESFQLYGTSSSVPDQGSTLALLAMGAGGVIAFRQRRKVG